MVYTTRIKDGHRGWHEGKVGVCVRFEPRSTPENASVDESRLDYGIPEFCIGFEPYAAFVPRLYSMVTPGSSRMRLCLRQAHLSLV